MDKKDAEFRIQKLKSEINKRNYEYFVLDKSEISEAVRDSLKKELIKLEKEFPDLITPDSPTQRVGSVLSGKLPKSQHITAKMSLQDVFSVEELEEWAKRIQKLVPNQKIEYLCELKIDGLNITLHYEKGRLKQALTRGNGKYGEIVTHTVRTIESVPLKLNENVDLEVSGEVYMTKKGLEKVNKEQELMGQEPFSNSRNAAAGGVRQLDPKIAAKRNLNVFFYELGRNSFKEKFETQDAILKKFMQLGLRVSKYFKLFKNIEGVISYYKHIQEIRSKLPFEIDGLVVKVNDKSEQKLMGCTAKFPRGQVAFKFPPEESTSKVLDIIIQVGRTGALTPVAVLEPTLVQGSIISRATLHNEDEIAKKDVRIGDTVIIRKAGDVIPEVVEVLKNLRTSKEKKYIFPNNCPVCALAAVRKEGEAIRRCTNPECPAMGIENIIHFVSKKAFNIEWLGEKVVVQLINKKLIKDAADIFLLKKEDFLQLELFKEKRAQKLIDAINYSLTISLDKFIFALGIRHVGEQTSYDFAYLVLQNKIKSNEKLIKVKRETGAQPSFFEQESEMKVEEEKFTILDLIETVKSFSLEDILNTDGIGEMVGESIYNWFNNAKNIDFLKRLYKAGVKLEEIKISTKQTFKGLSFVLTGTLKSFTREQAKELIKDLGGKILSEISPNTDYLLAGENPGSKLNKAKKIGIKILNEEEFLKLIG